MDIKQLIYFSTIVECKSISSAAKKLYMSQPPLSNQMILLENELGIKLFERGNREIVLTEAGKLFYERAKAIIELTESTKKEITDIKTGIHGLIRIGITSSLADYFISNCLNTYVNKNIKIELVEGNSYSLIEKLTNKEIEIAIIRTPFTFQGTKIGLKTEPLLAVGKELDTISNSSISIKELNDKNLIIHKRWQSILDDAFHKENLKLQPIFIADDARTCLKLALENKGITILPQSILDGNSISKTNIKVIDNLNLTSTITLIFNPKNYLSCASKDLINHIKNKFV